MSTPQERRVRDFVANWNGDEEHEITRVYTSGNHCFPLDHEDLAAVLDELAATRAGLEQIRTSLPTEYHDEVQVTGMSPVSAVEHLSAAWDAATGRMAKIAEMHHQAVTDGGMTSGHCHECDWRWPCPTHEWAKADSTRRSWIDCWDPRDDEPDEVAP